MSKDEEYANTPNNENKFEKISSSFALSYADIAIIRAIQSSV